MEIVDTRTRAFDPTELKHRGTGLLFKTLFLGDDEDPTNNYYFVLARQQSFFSPVHKHNFDQFRFPTKGNINILPDVDVREGELCYHPEGVSYGPQNDGNELKEILVLQFGGASGQGFLSHARLAESQKKLGDRGRLTGGKFYRRKDDGTEESPIDGFQALWEDQMGRELVYPKGRYDRIVKMDPEAYRWVKVGGREGVWKKTLGIFSERETRAEIFKVQNGAWEIPAEGATQLLFVLSGKGRTGGDRSISMESALRLHPGVSDTIVTGEELQVLRFVLPTLSK